jgi:hypothetical protein
LAGGDVVGEPLGVGDGLGDVVVLVLGLGLGLELAEAFSVDVGLGLGLEEVPDGDGDDVSEVDALGLDAGLLAGSLVEADALGEEDWLVSAVLADLLGDAGVLAEELPEVEELRAADELEPAWVTDLSDVAVLLPLAGLDAVLAVDAVSTASFGRDAHAVLTIGAFVVTASASPNMLTPRKKNPVRAPSAAGLRIRALTCATSLQ